MQGMAQPWPGQPIPPPALPPSQLQAPQYPPPHPYYQQNPQYPQQYPQYPPADPQAQPIPPPPYVDNAVGAAPASGQHSPNAFLKQQESQDLLQVPPPTDPFAAPSSTHLNAPAHHLAPQDPASQSIPPSMTSTPPKPNIDLPGMAVHHSRKRGSRRHLHENSLSLSHEPTAGRPPFSPFQANPPYPQADPSQQQHEKEKYKAELRQQMEEKKQREAAEKHRKLQEDLREEERLKREREELLRQY